MVMMRSSEPSSGSSILMDAPDSWRICLILWPPLPMMEPASCKNKHTGRLRMQRGVRRLFLSFVTARAVWFFFGEGIDVVLTSFGMVTCVVTTGPPMSLYEPLPPAEGRERGRLKVGFSLNSSNKKKQSL